uniref:BZIP domain-containing protein n=1 Tax=Leptocylindrus danicus TaxID=163516 RepID=A0A7S2PBD8_9STRA|mmetsp:Transcript_28353/g.41710  ORF Transcript_28353/g.41710 Transcript_28353/m.41710 type:complete len:362 (+) Transcript_28353:305-1390(+)
MNRLPPFPPMQMPSMPMPMKRPAANNGQPTPDEINEKKLRRMEKNRESARACRRRKKEAAKELERQIQLLEVENLRLRLQLKIGEEAEDLDKSEEEKVTRELASLISSGASEKEVDESIIYYTEKFADYGRDRRSAIDFHLRNVARLLQPTTTTSVAMRALEGGDQSQQMSSARSDQAITPSDTPSLSPNAKVQQSLKHSKTEQASASSNCASGKAATAESAEQSSCTKKSAGGSVPLEPKRLFQFLVEYLQVNEEQAKAMRDSRKVAKELDSALEESLAMLEELKVRLTQCCEDLEAEIDAVSKILTPTQVAKFLVWVSKNGACMHMLNELWRKEYPKSESSEQNGGTPSNSSESNVAPK